MAIRERASAHDLAPQRAIIDIGSNTVRLVIYGGPLRAPAVIHNEKVTARLGKGVAETGSLSPKAAAAALAALARYRLLLDLKGVREVQAVATAAVRDAADGEAFLDRVGALGFAPRLLSGSEEAIASAMGVIGAFPGAQGVVADLGGGSLELVEVAGESCSHGVSLPLGTLRLPALRAGGNKALDRAVTGMLAESGWQAPRGGTHYLVGGSFRSIARHALHLATGAWDDPHGFELEPAQAAGLARSILRARPETLAATPGITASRGAAMPDAAALLLSLIRHAAPERIVFSSWGLREGLLFGALSPAQRAQDPLLAGITSYAARYAVTAADAAMVAGWTAAANLPGGAPATERLRLAATMLALALARVEPNLRAAAAEDWAMRKRWIGLTNRERAVIGAALLASTGALDLPPAWHTLASDEALRAAQGWGLAARLVRRWSGASAEVLSASALAMDEAAMTLRVRKPLDALLNEGVQRDLKALAALSGRTAQVRVIAEDAALDRA